MRAVTLLLCAPAVAHGRVYVVGKDSVFAFDEETGHLSWSAPSPTSRTFSVVAVDGRVLIGGAELRDPETGELLWSAPEGLVSETPPAVTGGHFYGGIVDGNRILGWGGSVPGETPVY